LATPSDQAVWVWTIRLKYLLGALLAGVFISQFDLSEYRAFGLLWWGVFPVIAFNSTLAFNCADGVLQQVWTALHIYYIYFLTYGAS
jgi:hypothetical protein